jgi:hypothetical protein
MSATMDNLESDIDNLANRYDTSLYCYNQSADYSYIKPHVFKSINDMATLIKNDTSNDKWIIFIYSKSQAKSYMDIIGAEHCLYVDKDQAKEIETVVSKKTFDKKVLISTCVLDNGINIIDDKVKHIVIHESNKTKFVQMLGRIRHHRDIDGLYQQNINLYIPKLWKNNFSGKLGKMNKYLEQAELYKHNNKKFLKLYDRDFNKLSGELFYIDEGIKLNRVGLKALKINIEHYQSMVDGLEDNKYYFDINLRLGWLCLMDYEEIESVVDNEEIESLSDYLEMIEGKRLYANDIEILTKYIVEEISKVKIAKRYKSFKPSTIEKILRDELNMQYAIISSREDKIIDGKRIRNRYYIISEITNDNLKIS